MNDNIHQFPPKTKRTSPPYSARNQDLKMNTSNSQNPRSTHPTPPADPQIWMPTDNRQRHGIARLVPDRPSTAAVQNASSSLQPPPPPTQAPTKLNPKLLYVFLQAVIMAAIISLFMVFVGVAAVIFVHLCVAGGALHRRHRRQQRPISDESKSGCSVEELKALPRIKFTDRSRLNSRDVCAICLDYVLEGDWCRVLPACKHSFHSNCVDKWLFKVRACPVCRATVRLNPDDGKRPVVGVDNCGQRWSAFG